MGCTPWLAQPDFSQHTNLPFHNTQDNFKKSDTAHSGLNLQTSIINKENET